MIGIRGQVFRNTMRDRLYFEEGKKRLLYKCSSGHTSGGVGHNFDEPMSDELIGLIFDYDFNIALKEVSKFYSLHYNIRWNKLPINIRIVLCDMCFHMGITRLRKFKKMLRAISIKDYKTASKELLNSKYARQTPNRAKRNSKLLKICK